MEKLTIIDIDCNNFILLHNKTKKEYKYFIKFLNTKLQLQIDDEILMHGNLLNKDYVEYSNSLYFGPLDSDFGRSENIKEEDVIAIKHNGKIINLKRYFG